MVLLEVITGQSPILPGSDGVHIVQWVRQRLARGNIEGVVDSRMRGEYDINSVWKVADVALKCTAQSSSQRPLMPEVVMQLKESLELEEASGRSHNFYSGSTNPYSRSENIYKLAMLARTVLSKWKMWWKYQQVVRRHDEINSPFLSFPLFFLLCVVFRK